MHIIIEKCTFMTSKNHQNVRIRIVFADLEVKDGITYLHLYMAGLL